MELFAADTLSALLAIIVIDLVLAGDNAIVIALVARGLPQHLRRRTIIWGTVGAVGVRLAMTMIVVWLLKIPGLPVVGGLFLVWVAYKLLAPPVHEDSHAGSAGSARSARSGLWAAIRTIIVADAVMGIDNVLGVAGAAHGDFVLVLIGLLISVPIMILGSTFILKVVDRLPVIVYLGGAVLAYTAASMIVGEPVLEAYLEDRDVLAWIFYALTIGGVLLVGYIRRRRSQSA